ncbi:hypothetical protein EON63_14915 [archaeon]|nr:MAG: hypothetical protein EON63_14915 [archaeon]
MYIFIYLCHTTFIIPHSIQYSHTHHKSMPHNPYTLHHNSTMHHSTRHNIILTPYYHPTILYTPSSPCAAGSMLSLCKFLHRSGRALSMAGRGRRQPMMPMDKGEGLVVW